MIETLFGRRLIVLDEVPPAWRISAAAILLTRGERAQLAQELADEERGRGRGNLLGEIAAKL